MPVDLFTQYKEIVDEYNDLDKNVSEILSSDPSYSHYYTEWWLYSLELQEITSPNNFKRDQNTRLQNLMVIKSNLVKKLPIFSRFIEKNVVGNVRNIERYDLQKGVFYFGNLEILMERGLGSMMDTFLEEPRRIKNGKLTQGGTPIKRTDLENVGGYKNEASFRRALGKLREIIKENKLPMAILNPQTNHYLLQIDG